MPLLGERLKPSLSYSLRLWPPGVCPSPCPSREVRLPRLETWLVFHLSPATESGCMKSWGKFIASPLIGVATLLLRMEFKTLALLFPKMKLVFYLQIHLNRFSPLPGFSTCADIEGDMKKVRDGLLVRELRFVHTECKFSVERVKYSKTEVEYNRSGDKITYE